MKKKKKNKIKERNEIKKEPKFFLDYNEIFVRHLI